MRYIIKTVKAGLFWINFTIAGIGIVISLVFYESFDLYPLLASLVITSLVNVFLGATTSVSNINSKFRRWLFNDSPI